MNVTRREFIHGALAAGSLVALAACGGSAASPAGASSAGGSASGTLTLGVSNEPQTLDPMFATGVNEYLVDYNVMEGLFILGPDLSPQPMLAESYTTPDSKTWEFKLRQGIKFHNGEPFDADAVKVTYDRSMNKDLKIRNTWASDVNVTSVEVVDASTVRFHTKSPTPQMLARLAKDHYIFPPKYVTDTDPKEVARKPIGTGPYVFKEWAVGDRITLEANPNYAGAKKPSIKTVVWRWAPEDATRLANLQAGAFDMINALDPTAIDQVNANAKLMTASVQSGRRVYVGFNTKIKPFDDVRVRQALNYGTDIEAIAKNILAGTVQRMRGWVMPPYENPELKGYAYDAVKAKDLLAQAGLANGFDAIFDVDNNNYLKLDEFPQAIVTSLRQIGVNLTINKIEAGVATQMQRDRKTHQLYLRGNAAIFDPGLDFDVWRLDHAGNGSQWDNAEFKALMEKLYTGGTTDERKQWAYQAQAILSEQAPALFLWKQPDIYGLNKRVQGFKPNGNERVRLLDLTLT